MKLLSEMLEKQRTRLLWPNPSLPWNPALSGKGWGEAPHILLDPAFVLASAPSCLCVSVLPLFMFLHLIKKSNFQVAKLCDFNPKSVKNVKVRQKNICL